MVLKLQADWCDKHDLTAETIYMPDGACSCGIAKHHYHCPKCGKVSQVG